MALSTSPSQTVSLWPPTPTPALMDSGAKMESLSNLGSGAVGRKRPGAGRDRDKTGPEKLVELTQGQSSPRRQRGSLGPRKETRVVCAGHRNKQERTRFGPESRGSVFYSEPCL